MNVEEYVTHETDDVSDGEIEYAEAGEGNCWLMYHNQDFSYWQDRDKFEFRVAVYDDQGYDDNPVFQNNEEISGDQAGRILEKWDGWDYVE